MKTLTLEQVQSYRHDGFLYPIPALGADEAARCLADLERAEAFLGSPLPKAEMKWRGAAYTYLPWVNELVRHPRILDVVEEVIGPDILVFWSTFFIKEPGSATFAAWHQDATYFGLEPYEHVTAWVALSDASREAGCMEVLSSQGAPRQRHHAAARLANSINGAGQLIVEPLDETKAVAMTLRAGELSLHHTLCPHRSAPNRASHRRVGLGISYVPAHVRPVGSHRMPALLVRGSNAPGHFDPLPSPAAEFSADGIALHERTYKRYRENYYEQEKRHDEQFAGASAAHVQA
ncbi:MAG: phytanoyl-CoA dioxygenase family protein [Betaproteobacteria bacterium]|nr:phytanoyl-CoA dioxygenase family protein [Betaproteobacteria bacterium]